MRKMTITIDDVTLDRLRAMRELCGTPYSAAVRLAVLAYYQDKFSPPSTQKNRPSVVASVADVDDYVI